MRVLSVCMHDVRGAGRARCVCGDIRGRALVGLSARDASASLRRRTREAPQRRTPARTTRRAAIRKTKPPMKATDVNVCGAASSATSRSAGSSGTPVVEILIRGNRRVEEDAIRARLRTVEGAPADAAQIARDVRALFAQGFSRDVRVFREDTPGGLRIIYEVDESPVIREITISGNDNIDGDDIKEALTLTTGVPLDFPLLRENRERVAAVYRSEGYYLAEVAYAAKPIECQYLERAWYYVFNCDKRLVAGRERLERAAAVSRLREGTGALKIARFALDINKL